MKKIIFLVHFSNLKKSSGIIEKIMTQSKNMYNEGILFKTYILFKGEEIEDIKLFNSYEYVEFVPVDFYKSSKNIFKKFNMSNKIFDVYTDICLKEKDNYNYNYIYIRYNPLYLGFMKFCKRFKGKFIFEHNSVEMSEYKANRSIYSVIMSKLFDKKIKNCACGYVCVSKEIYDYQKNIYTNQNGVIITNGIDVKRFKERKVPIFDGKNLNMLFVGNIRYWHGLERLFYSIEKYNGKVNVTFNIFGPINQKDYLTPILNDLKHKDKIILHGYKTQKELDKEFNINHIAVGCLGAYKKKIESGSTLKNREYFARGIPFVCAGEDEDIFCEDNNGLYLELKNDDSIFDLEDIIEFVKEFYNNSDKNTKRIRSFAETNLDWNSKIKKLKDYLNEMDK